MDSIINIIELIDLNDEEYELTHHLVTELRQNKFNLLKDLEDSCDVWCNCDCDDNGCDCDCDYDCDDGNDCDCIW